MFILALITISTSGLTYAMEQTTKPLFCHHSPTTITALAYKQEQIAIASNTQITLIDTQKTTKNQEIQWQQLHSEEDPFQALVFNDNATHVAGITTHHITAWTMNSNGTSNGKHVIPACKTITHAAWNQHHFHWIGDGKAYLTSSPHALAHPHGEHSSIHEIERREAASLDMLHLSNHETPQYCARLKNATHTIQIGTIMHKSNNNNGQAGVKLHAATRFTHAHCFSKQSAVICATAQALYLYSPHSTTFTNYACFLPYREVTTNCVVNRDETHCLLTAGANAYLMRIHNNAVESTATVHLEQPIDKATLQ